jgi:hypothetical protein
MELSWTSSQLKQVFNMMWENGYLVSLFHPQVFLFVNPILGFHFVRDDRQFGRLLNIGQLGGKITLWIHHPTEFTKISCVFLLFLNSLCLYDKKKYNLLVEFSSDILLQHQDSPKSNEILIKYLELLRRGCCRRLDGEANF